jgi:hypothetical protein
MTIRSLIVDAEGDAKPAGLWFTSSGHFIQHKENIAAHRLVQGCEGGDNNRGKLTREDTSAALLGRAIEPIHIHPAPHISFSLNRQSRDLPGKGARGHARRIWALNGRTGLFHIETGAQPNAACTSPPNYDSTH